MQESILEIGKILYSPDSFLDNLIRHVELKDKKDNPYYVVQINLDKKNERIELNFSEMSDTTAKDLLYVGSADGSSSPQWYICGNKFDYLISQTVPNLVGMEIEGLSDELSPIIKDYFWDYGEQQKGNKRYRYLMNLQLLDPAFPSKDEILLEAGGEVKDLPKVANKHLDNYLKEKFQLSNKEIALYYLAIDKTPLSNIGCYKERIIREKTESSSKEQEGICYSCGSTEDLTQDTSKFKLKFYTTTNLNFPSNFNDYAKNMLLCKGCISKILIGEQYIYDNFRTKLAGFDVFVIPHILFPSTTTKKDLDKISSKTLTTFNEAKKVAGFMDMEGEILDTFYLENEENYFLFNIIFYKISQKSVKAQKFIKDVSPSRFQKIITSSKDTIARFKGIFNDEKLIFGLESIYFLTPVKIKKGEVIEYRKLLNIYDAIFSGTKLDRRVIIQTQTKLFKIKHLEQYQQYNTPMGSLHRAVIQSNMYLNFLTKLGNIKEGERLDYSGLKVNGEIKEYIQEMSFDEQESAMFLLGYLIGKVGNRQYSDRSGKKPILNKLNFNGMDLSKVKRLSSDMLNKLRQNKILQYNELTFAAHKQLLDKQEKNWNLNKNENLYYILSGYGFATSTSINSKGGKQSEE